MPLLWCQFLGEIHKLFARKRTWIGFGVFLTVELLVLALLQLPKVQRTFRRWIEQAGYGFEDYFSGLTLAQQMVGWTIFFLGALYLSLVAGDVVAKEVEDGTMRMVLCRPVSRVRLLLIKYLACIVYTGALVLFIGVSALLAGFAWRGFGGLFVIQPVEGIFELYDFWPGLARYLLGLPLLALSLLTVTSLGFFFSCGRMKPAAATIATLSVFFIDLIFRGIPYFETLRPWFLTARMAAWLNIFRSYPPYPAMIEDYAFLMGINFTLVVMGIAMFQARDLKS